MTDAGTAPIPACGGVREGAHLLIAGNEAKAAAWSRTLVARGCTTTLVRATAPALRLVEGARPDHLLLVTETMGEPQQQLIRMARRLGVDVLVIGPPQPNGVRQQALALGAREYLSQPVSAERLWTALGRTLPPGSANSRAEVRSESRLLLGRCSAMRVVFEQIRRVAPTSATVLITGESGTGKEMVAQTIHRMSTRQNRPFIALNCGAIPAQLIESELFGHEKGSFTGAIRDHLGYFERAHGGTLFLDEIIEMPLELQVKLLRVLETRRFSRVGSMQVQKSDVRIIAATNQSPRQAIREGRLRPDLLYRIQVFPIVLPPVRERKEDIPLLANHFLQTLNQNEGRQKQFSDAALTALCQYPWPGNLRELKNVVYRGYIMADRLIGPGDLPAEIVERPPSSVGPSIKVTVGTSLAEMEKRLILETLRHCGGKRERAARMLGISAKTLYNRLREYDEPVPRHRP